MIFLLDENFPKTAENYLIEQGHQVFDVRSTENEGSDDYTIFTIAQNKKAVFLTTDRDFFHTIPFSFPEHYGVIIIALKQPNRKSLLAKLKWVIEKSGIYDFSNKIILLRDNTYSIRK